MSLQVIRIMLLRFLSKYSCGSSAVFLLLSCFVFLVKKNHFGVQSSYLCRGAFVLHTIDRD